MRNESKRVAAVVAVAAVVSGGAALGSVGAQARPAAQKVTVSLKEFRLVPSTSVFHAGRTTLVAVNRGKLPHALAIAGPGVKARTSMLRPGRSARLTVTLKSGTYSLWCPVGNHASLGMKLSVKVGGAASTVGAIPVAPAPTTSTTPAGGGYDDPSYGY